MKRVEGFYYNSINGMQVMCQQEQSYKIETITNLFAYFSTLKHTKHKFEVILQLNILLYYNIG